MNAIQLEPRLFLRAQGNTPSMMWRECDGTWTTAGKSLRHNIQWASQQDRQMWLASVERWQANPDNDCLRATGNPLWSAASSFAAMLKA